MTTTNSTSSLPRPDLSCRPHRLVVEREMKASAEVVYGAWTERFDTWFAQPGLIRMRPVVGEPFFFETEHEASRHSHYGRFLALERNRLVELTWMTGQPGTAGAETVLTVNLNPTGESCHLRLTHAGFYDDAGVHQHEGAWRTILAGLDDRLVAESTR